MSHIKWGARRPYEKPFNGVSSLLLTEIDIRFISHGVIDGRIFPDARAHVGFPLLDSFTIVELTSSGKAFELVKLPCLPQNRTMLV